MRFLVDAQLPPALARWLVSHGHHAEHVYDVGLGDAPDREVWVRAVSTGAIVVTKDEDFVLRAHVASVAPVIVWTRYGNTRTSALLRRFELGWPLLVDALNRGETVVELA